VLAFDFGFARIGIATGNLLTNTATPLSTVDARHGPPWTSLDRVIAEWHPGQLVVGLPDPDSATQVWKQAREFATALQTRYRLPVAAVEESLSSRAAESELREARRSGYLRRRLRKTQIDSHAACLIAEQWMSARTDQS
jgi:putative Holliday junction resolvase